jgi:hypothetical protein
MIKIPEKMTAKTSHAVGKAVKRTVFPEKFAMRLFYHKGKVFTTRLMPHFYKKLRRIPTRAGRGAAAVTKLPMPPLAH